MESIVKLANKFREKIELEISNSDYVDVELNSFPLGSCEVTSQMFGLFLLSCGFNNVKLTFNQRRKLDLTDYRKDSHVWIVINDLFVVDLTGDQYSDCNEKVIISKDHKFHKSFYFVAYRKLDRICLSRPGCPTGYSKFYQKIEQEMKQT